MAIFGGKPVHLDLSDEELEDIEELDTRGPIEREEDERADIIEFEADIRLAKDKKGYDEYEEEIDKLNAAIDDKYFEDSD